MEKFSTNKLSKLYERNIYIVYMFNLLHGLMFFLPIYTLYLNQELFSAVNVGIIIALTSLGRVVFEVPTGAIADMFGRKNTLILAGMLSITALVLLGIGGSFFVFVLYAIIDSLATALISGTDTALLSDSMNATNKKVNFQKIISLNIGMWQIGAVLSSLLSGIFIVYSLKMPIFMTIIPFCAAFFLLFLIKEPSYDRSGYKNIFPHMKQSIKIFLHEKQLVILFFSSMLLFTFSEIAHQFNPLFFDYKNIPVIYFGYIFASLFVFSFFGSILTSHYLSKKFGNKNTLLLSAITSPIMLLLATFSSGIYVAVFMSLSSLFWGLRLPIITDLFNKKTPSEYRATILSINGFSSIIGLVIFTPLFGYLIDIYKINFTIKLIGICSLFAIVTILFIKDDG